MSSQTTVVTTASGKKAGASAARKKKITKYVANKRMSRAAAFKQRRPDVGTLVSGYRQTIMPERFITTLESSQEFYLTANNLDILSGNYQSIRVNSIVQPFNTTYAANSVAPTYSMNGTFVQGYGIATPPIGYAFFTSTYKKYKVLGYKIKVSVMTGTNTDLVEAVLLPVGQDEIPNSSAANVNCSVLRGQPKAKSRLCHNGGPNNILSLKGSVYELLGMRKSQWMDTDGTTPPNIPNVPGYVGFYLQTLNGLTNAATLVVSIQLYQIVEFTDLNNGNFLS